MASDFVFEKKAVLAVGSDEVDLGGVGVVVRTQDLGLTLGRTRNLDQDQGLVAKIKKVGVVTVRDHVLVPVHDLGLVHVQILDQDRMIETTRRMVIGQDHDLDQILDQGLSLDLVPNRDQGVKHKKLRAALHGPRGTPRRSMTS